MNGNGSECKHKWNNLSTHYDKRREGDGYAFKFTRADVFFCEKCCEQKEIKREERSYSEYPEPIWWRH